MPKVTGRCNAESDCQQLRCLYAFRIRTRHYQRLGIKGLMSSSGLRPGTPARSRSPARPTGRRCRIPSQLRNRNGGTPSVTPAGVTAATDPTSSPSKRGGSGRRASGLSSLRSRPGHASAPRDPRSFVIPFFDKEPCPARKRGLPGPSTTLPPLRSRPIPPPVTTGFPPHGGMSASRFPVAKDRCRTVVTGRLRTAGVREFALTPASDRATAALWPRLDRLPQLGRTKVHAPCAVPRELARRVAPHCGARRRHGARYRCYCTPRLQTCMRFSQGWPSHVPDTHAHRRSRQSR